MLAQPCRGSAPAGRFGEEHICSPNVHGAVLTKTAKRPSISGSDYAISCLMTVSIHMTFCRLAIIALYEPSCISDMIQEPVSQWSPFHQGLGHQYPQPYVVAFLSVPIVCLLEQWFLGAPVAMSIHTIVKPINRTSPAIVHAGVMCKSASWSRLGMMADRPRQGSAGRVKGASFAEAACRLSKSLGKPTGSADQPLRPGLFQPIER